MVQNSNIRSVDGSQRRREREEDRRQEILSAAARVFRRNGFAATGMRDIAREANLSPGNLYYYFESKSDLLFYCQDHSLDRLLDSCRRRREGQVDVRLEGILREHLTCTLNDLDGAAAHLELGGLTASARERLVEKRDRYEREIRTLIEQGIAECIFAPCQPALVTRAILGALNWTARWYDPAGPQTPATLADEFSRYLMKGLRP